MRRLPLLLAAHSVLLASPCLAQAFTLTSGNTTWNWVPQAAPVAFGTITFPTFWTSPCDPDPAAAEDQSNLYQWGLGFSVVGSNFGRPFSDNGHGSYLQSPSGTDIMVETITDVASLGLMDATILTMVRDTGPASGYVTHNCAIVNTSGSQLDIKIYVHANIDVGGAFDYDDDFSLPAAGPDRILISDNPGTPANDCGRCTELWGLNPDRYEVGGSSTISTSCDGGIDLADSGLPFFSGSDLECGFQWDLSIPPGGNATVDFALSMNHTYSGTLGSATNTGVALGAGGPAPAISASTTPILGQPLDIDLTNMGAAGTATILLGTATQLPAFGLTLGISPVLTTVSVGLSGGVGTLSLPASECDPALGGVPFSWQAFAIDNGSPAALPLIHTDVLTTVFGD